MGPVRSVASLVTALLAPVLLAGCPKPACEHDLDCGALVPLPAPRPGEPCTGADECTTHLCEPRLAGSSRP